jgi:hypothetical protein
LAQASRVLSTLWILRGIAGKTARGKSVRTVPAQKTGGGMFGLIALGCYAIGLILVIVVALSTLRSKKKEDLDFIDPT